MKPSLLSSARLSFPLATAIAALHAAPSAQATPYSWTGLTAGTWNTGTNWSGSTVPLITDDLTILGPLNVAGALTIDFDADNSAKSLTFSNTAATAITNTTSGSLKTLTLGSGGITTGAGAVQIGANVAGQGVNINLGAAQIWNIGAGGLTATNVISGAATGITKTGTGNLTINTSNINSFTGGLNVNGGTLTLDYTNLATPTNLVAATNALQINNATLTITGKNLAAATTAQTFAGTTLGAGRNTINIAKGTSATSATLNLGALTANAGSVTIFSPTTAWTTTASTTEIVNISAGGNVSIPGSGTAFANAGIFHRVAGGAVGTLRLAAVNTGTGQLLLKANAGNIAASNVTDATGSYQLHAGNIALTNTGATAYGFILNATGAGTNITIANSGTLTLNSVIQIKGTESANIIPGTGSTLVIGAEKNLVIAMDNAAGFGITAPIVNNGGGASGITIVGTAPTGTPGAVTLSGANAFTGATSIHNGLLSLNNTLALGGSNPGVNGTSAINMTAGATLSSGIGGANPVNTISAPITLSGTGNTSFRIGQGAGSNTHTFNINGAIGGTTGNVVYTTSTNSFNNGTSLFVLGAAGTYTGNTLITTGNGGNNPVTVRSGIANALPTTTVLTMAGGSGGGSGRFLTLDLNGNDQTLAGLTHTLTIPDDRQYRVSSTGAATLTINNSAAFSFGGSTRDSASGSGQDGTVTSAQITGAISLVKDGAGTFTLGGTLTNGATALGNAFTGSTKILGGILVLGQTNSIQNSAFDTAGSALGTASDGLRTTVTTLTLGGLTGGNDFSSRFTTTAGGYADLTALTLNPGTGVTNSYSGDIGNGSLRLTKSGLGTQVLTTTNSYTGGTTIAQGTLRINSIADYSAPSSIGAPGSGDLVIGSANNGVLDYVGSGGSTNRTFTVGSTTATQAGGAFILANGGSALTFTAATFNNVQGTATVARTLTLGGAELGAIDGTIQDNNAGGGGTVAVTKQDAGTWTLGGNSSYTGSTTISAGTLLINGNSSTATGAVNVNGGTLGGTGRSGAAVTVAATATLSPGASIESLDVASLTMASNSIFAYEVADNTSTGADLLASRTMLSLAGATLGLDPVSLAALGGGGWTLGNKLTLISYLGADVTSGFTDYVDDTNYTFGSNLWRFNYNDTVAGNNFGADAVAGGQDRFVTITVVPEPDAAALLGALGALALLRRRR
jgi:fibronectin-binding autotransporter adhesin